MEKGSGVFEGFFILFLGCEEGEKIEGILVRKMRPMYIER